MTITAARAQAPFTLAEPAPTGLGLRETSGLRADLGVSLLLTVAASFVVLAGRPLGASVLAIAVGAVIGATLLGGLSASIVSLTVASLLTVALPGALRAHRRTA